MWRLMFDESEIRFLGRAVELNLLTPNQRERLMGFQDKLPANLKVTSLVVEAGLMVEEEVQQVLTSVASGVSARPPQPPTESNSPDIGPAATVAGLAEILGENGGNNTSEAHALASAVRQVFHGTDTPPLDASYETARQNQEAMSQKFPLPGAGEPAPSNGEQQSQPPFPLPGAPEQSITPEEANQIQIEQAQAEQEESNSPLKEFAASSSEISDILEDPASTTLEEQSQ